MEEEERGGREKRGGGRQKGEGGEKRKGKDGQGEKKGVEGGNKWQGIKEREIESGLRWYRKYHPLHDPF